MSQIELIRKYQIHPIKRFGQNFLIDGNIQQKILKSLPLNEGKVFLEIGPGLGALTEPLLKKGEQVIAVEVDKKLAAILDQELTPRFPNHFKIIQSDILELMNEDSLKQLLPEGGVLIGNLPYSISSPVLFKALDCSRFFENAFFTLQKEVVDRLVARPGTPDYGRLTVGFGLFAKVRREFDISPTCFSPKPDVRSSFFSIEFKGLKLSPQDRQGVLDLVKIAFSERRKQLFGLLSRHHRLKQKKIDDLIIRLKVSQKVRAEELPPQTFLNLYELLQQNRL